MIGSGTLRSDLQSKFARMRGKPDPNLRIGAQEYSKNEKFLALDGINIEINRGDRVGIIGANGAGKSTLLKILSRITSPTDGQFCYRGRISSMLEVGTGFHPELTGRENVYLNGAILGMTKAEIDRKFDQIVEFAEMAQFIDTPVKRYSSGMYVKLAFSVAAHLDSEIMIMDEVLAVGDAKFQNKCLGKMSDEANSNNRTILYVSHNMSTIQRLCSRVIVLDHGKVVYDGDTPGGVARYLSVNRDEATVSYLEDIERNMACKLKVKMMKAWFPGKENNLFMQGDKLHFRLQWRTNADVYNLVLRIYFNHMTSSPVGFSSVPFGDCKAGHVYETEIELDLAGVVPGSYYIGCEFHEIDSAGANEWHDYIQNMLQIEILENQQIKLGAADNTNKIPWNHNMWGSIRMPSQITENIVE